MTERGAGRGAGLARSTLTLASAALCLGCAASCLGCTAVRPAPSRPAESAGGRLAPERCVRLDGGVNSAYRLPLPGAVSAADQVAALAVVPGEVRRTVLAGGLEPLLAATLIEQTKQRGQTSLGLLALQQRLDVQLHALEAQLSAALFEVDCTGDQLEAMLHTLERQSHSRELALTISSLVVTAVVATSAGLWDLADEHSKGPPALGIAGGVAAAGLGVAAFVPRDRTVSLEHPRNLLDPIRRGDDPAHLYPTFVTRLLSLPPSAGGSTPRERLLESFRAIIEQATPSEERAHAASVLYGAGGLYDERLLRTREQLYGELESQLSAFHRDLELLQRFLVQQLPSG